MIQQRSPAVFSVGGHREWFQHGQGRPLFDVVHPAFPLQTVMSSIHQSALKNGSEEAVVARDTPEPHVFPSLYSCQNRFLWAYTKYNQLSVKSSKQEIQRSFLRLAESNVWICFKASRQVHASKPQRKMKMTRD